MRAGTNFALLVNASVGAMKEGLGSNWLNGKPEDGQLILDLLRRLPPTDLAFSTVSSGNTDQNGFRDHVYWSQALQPKIMTTGHAPVGGAMQYYSGLLKQLNLMEQPRNEVAGLPARPVANPAQPHRSHRHPEAAGLRDRQPGLGGPEKREQARDAGVLRLKRTAVPGLAAGHATVPRPKSDCASRTVSDRSTSIVRS